VKEEKDCPLLVNHTPCPDDYVERALWAEKMMVSHKQQRCVGCGLYAVWVPKRVYSENE